MRKNYIMFLFAAMALLAGCAKEEIKAPVGDGHSLTITLGQTKTHMGALDGTKHKIYWSNKDKINVNGNESDELSGLGDTESTATFHFATPLSGTPYNIVYPASIYADATHVTLPATQTYKDGGFADGMYPMAGYSADGSSITINHLCAIVKVSILQETVAHAEARGKTPDTDKLVSVTFKGKNSEQVSGDFTINHSAATLTGASSAAADKEVRVVKNIATSTSEAVVYYIVVPAQTYSNGISIIVQDVNGDTQTKQTEDGTPVTLAAGKLYTPAEFEFVPDGGSTAIEIANAEDLIAFATAYNAKTYADLGASLVAKVTADITFDATTSAAFNATGGIGTPYGGDNYFNGLFNGNNKTISGLDGTVSIFGGIGENGTVKDMTINNTCSFTFTHNDTAEGQFATIAGYHKGTLDNVKVAADVSIVSAVDTVKHLTALGGLVGRATVGKVQNGCEYSGLISTPDTYLSSAKLIIGGLVGRYTNAGSVSNSYFKGAISNASKVISTDTSNPYLIIGGVVGHMGGGSTLTLTNSTTDHTGVASAYDGFNGQIVNKTTTAYNSAVGGIVGELDNGTISDCTNAAEIACSIFKPGNTYARYMKTGGIVGKVNKDGVVTNCTNNGLVQHRSNPRLQDLGGIAGYNAGTITSCTNNAAVNHMTTGVSGITNKGGRIVNLAGVIGENAANAVVSDVHNTANIQISAMEDNYDTEGDKPVCEVRMGGVIAYNLAAIDGGGTKNITNSGQVYFSPNMTKQFIGYELGGVVGYSSASVQNAKNSGYVYFRWNSDVNVASMVYMGGVVGKMAGDGTISGCINEGGASNAGEVYPNVKAGSAGHNNIFAGGILGYSESSVIISDCSNSGYIHGGNTTKVNGKTFYVGGIVALLKGESQILDCSNTGQLNNAQSNNTFTIGSTTLTGGIVGHVEGTDSNPIVIGGSTGCSVDASVASTRGWVAGIAGYAKYVNISSCTVKQDINCAAHGIGGLVANAQYCTITGSTFKGDKVHANNTQAGAGQGGLVGNMSNSIVDGCSSYATTLTNNVSLADVGAIVGVSGENNTVKNCHYKATITTTAGSVTAKIAGVGTFTDGGGNVADL